VPHVIAVDLDAAVLSPAKARHPDLPIEWIHADILNLPLPTGEPFEPVLSVASLHHVDAKAALTRFAQLGRPGGIVGVVGLAANDWTTGQLRSSVNAQDWPPASSEAPGSILHPSRGPRR
jgi:ubiquinone/menaquinone biosynthesis C-methylase UbiE